MVKQAAIVFGPGNSAKKRFDIHFDAGRHDAGQDRALAENSKYFAGHAGDETYNFLIAEMNPLGVCAGQTNETDATTRVQHTHGFSFFSTHDFGHPIRIFSYHTRNQEHFCAGKGQFNDRICQTCYPDRAAKIFRFRPTFATANHATQQNTILASRQPITHLCQ